MNLEPLSKTKRSVSRYTNMRVIQHAETTGKTTHQGRISEKRHDKNKTPKNF